MVNLNMWIRHNAYDTMIRPLTAVHGYTKRMEEGEMGREVLKSMYEGTKETLSPFVVNQFGQQLLLTL